jgi:hypothetical protein
MGYGTVADLVQRSRKMLGSRRGQVVVCIGDEVLRERVHGAIDGVRAVVRTEADAKVERNCNRVRDAQ